MKTTPANPVPPDDESEKDNGPSLSANIEKGHQSIQAREQNASDPEENQAPLDSELSLVESAAAAPEPLDPEDLTSFALDENYDTTVAKKVLTTVPVRKPSKEGFVRTKPDPDGWKVYTILELKEEGKFYLVLPQLAAALEAEGESTLVKARLVPAVDRLGNFFLWVLKMSDRDSSWHLSALRAAERAKTEWVRVQANMSAGVYDTHVALKLTSQPQWPEEDLATILKIAFDGRVISSRDHPVLKELRGDF